MVVQPPNVEITEKGLSVNLKWEDGLAFRLMDALSATQNAIDANALEAYKKHSPFLTGALQKSHRIEKPGKIINTAPYARRKFYEGAVQTTINPFALNAWAIAANDMYQDEWLLHAQQVLARELNR